jgi:hypothetical protein
MTEKQRWLTGEQEDRIDEDSRFCTPSNEAMKGSPGSSLAPTSGIDTTCCHTR